MYAICIQVGFVLQYCTLLLYSCSICRDTCLLDLVTVAVDEPLAQPRQP